MNVYAKFSVKPDWVEHEVLFTEHMMQFPVEIIRRGKNNYNADGIVDLAGTTYVELENSDKSDDVLVRKMERYTLTDDLVLWVARDERRRDRLIQLAQRGSDNMLFTVVGADVMVDIRGQEITIGEFLEQNPPQIGEIRQL